MEEKRSEVGKVMHYYSKIGVAVVNLTNELRVGDEILIRGKSTELRQKVESMQIEHKNVEIAKAGQSIGLKVNERVKEGDIVYKILV
ncbi:MAG: translation elongation factor-like protein [Nitrososphaerota archaeon]